MQMESGDARTERGTNANPDEARRGYGDGGGLYLQVRGPENRSWRFRFKLHVRKHLMGWAPSQTYPPLKHATPLPPLISL